MDGHLPEVWKRSKRSTNLIAVFQLMRMELLQREHRKEQSIALKATELAAVEFAPVSEQCVAA
jgi:hypothetical protein